VRGSLPMDTSSYEKTIEALTLISKAITSDQYIEDILRLIVIVTAKVMNSEVCSLWLLDEKSKSLAIRATQSIDSDYIKERSVKLGEGVVGYVAQHNRSYVVKNVLEEPRFKEKELAKKMGLVSMLSVPMSVKDRVIGVINCYTSVPHEFSETEKNLFTTVANQSAVAIFNTELMVKSKVIQEELESRKLVGRAKDLLMRRRNMTGEEAHRWIQKRSMDSRKSMREVAEAVLLSEEL
jgi:signal transduction protein with GAF and PtsI domain